jgi:hypothetical protein
VSALAVLAFAALVAAAPAPAPPATFLKGQLHLHSNRSGDSQTPPADVVRWYAEHGFDFIVFTDHNRVTVEPGQKGMLVLPGVELTQNLRDCAPPPPQGLACLLHVNALFVAPPPPGDPADPADPPWGPDGGNGRVAIYRRALVAAQRLGGLAQLNHPNFQYGADGAIIAALAREGLTLLEVGNMSWDSNDNPKDAGRPNTEALWDAALSAGATVWGTATDDAHNYYDATAAAQRGEQVFTGDRGFVMVRARKDPAAIRAALARGDFYASSGVLLSRVDVAGGALIVEVDARSPGSHHFDFVGRGGKILARADGRRATFPLASAGDGYVRVDVADANGRRAWVQPFHRAPKDAKAR